MKLKSLLAKLKHFKRRSTKTPVKPKYMVHSEATWSAKITDPFSYFAVPVLPKRQLSNVY